MNNNLLIQISRNDLQEIVTTAISNYFNENPSIHLEPEPSIMTITEAASFLNVAIPTIYAKVSKQIIPFHKRGKRLYFDKTELVNWIKK